MRAYTNLWAQYGRSLAAAPAPAPAPAPSITLASYRTGQQWLFADVQRGAVVQNAGSYNETPARAGISNADSFNWGSSGGFGLALGPTNLYVEGSTKWPWVNAGGDWINTAGTSQATTLPHATFAANSATSGSASYLVDITAGCQAAFNGSRWNAYIIKVTGGTRAIATQNHPTLAPPSIAVTYTDGTSETLDCHACVSMPSGTAYGKAGAQESTIVPSVAIGFARPSKAVASATLSIAVTQHTNTAATINFYLANPTVTTPTVVTGVAAGYPLDSGLSAGSGVIVAHDYHDGSVLTDWLNTTNINPSTTANWSPDLWGAGAADDTKLPTALGGVSRVGKWNRVNYEDGYAIALVSSSYTGEGFAPVAAGIGALRIHLPKSTAADGGTDPNGYSGTLGADLKMMFPKAISGLVGETYTRFYYRYHANVKTIANTKMLRQSASATATYALMAGKFGPGVHHTTTFGGNDNTGGGNKGWSNRGGIALMPGDTPVSGAVPYVHSWDMLGRNMEWGQSGGMGGGLYPDRWYCVEIRCKLNTWNVAGGSPADGVMEIWLDGVKVATHTGWSYRDGPPLYSGSLPPTFAGYRDMGAIGLWLNCFQGGTLTAEEDRWEFFTGIVCGTSYIGPMAIPAPAGPNWASTAVSGTWNVVPSANTFLSLDPKDNPLLNPTYSSPGHVAPWDPNGSGHPKLITAWNSASYNEATDEMWLAGVGGHNDSASNAVYKHSLNSNAPAWTMVRAPSGSLTVGYGVTPLSDSAAQQSTGMYTDGRPRSTHTYNGQLYVPGVGPVQCGLASMYYLADSKAWIVFYNEATGEATYSADPSPTYINKYATYGSGAAYDPTRRCIWWCPGAGGGYMVKYQLPASGPANAGSFSNVGSLMSLPGYVSLTYLPDSDCLLITQSPYDHSSTSYKVFDCATGTVYTPTFSGSLPTGMTGGNAQPRWVPALGAVCMWNSVSNTTLIAKLTPPANPRTGTWTISTLPVAGSNTVVPMQAPNDQGYPGQTTGTYGRFAYSPNLGGFLLLNDAAGPTYFYKI